MSIDLLNEIEERGYHLHYLRGPTPWEASISRTLPEQTADGYISAVGYGCGPTASIALDEALDHVETDYTRLLPEHYPKAYTHTPEPAAAKPDLFALLRTSLKPSIPILTRRKL